MFSKERNLWITLAIVILASFAILLYYGTRLYKEAPPVPERVTVEGGTVLYTKEDIQKGQNVYQSIGGQELGSVWGHGAYVAPDWSADWLHREAVQILNIWAAEEGSNSYDDLPEERKVVLQERLKKVMRENQYDPETGELTIADVRAQAIENVSSHYTDLFTGGPAEADLREKYSMAEEVVTDPDRMRALNAFFFWASWACITERPGQDITYTHNWPPDELVGNTPTADLHLWSGFSVILLIAGIGLLTYYYASRREEEIHYSDLPKKDPLLGLTPTPSMKATLKYFWIVTALMVVQIIMGIITAHYGVEGQAFYGIPLSEFMPYSLSRTWHVQIGIFWIATSWLATGLFIAPAVSGHEPKFQKAGVNFLFICLLIIVVGSIIGQWYGVMQKIGLGTNFWFGHMGFEYVDLGRFWQIFLFIGLWVWLILMARALMPALKAKKESRNLLGLFLVSCIAIALFYGAALMWGQNSNYAIAEYWRWWVVHLWVEGFFEVFATVVIAFLFVRMGLLRTKIATITVLFSTIIFLFGGIIGTFHHLYFSGTPTGVLAFGATFSALEVVPLVLIGFEAYHNLTLSRATQWVKAYRWPIYCFIAVAFWNLVGAGIFGFLINPPIALYYMQGLNTTPVHGHTALFGVYGMLGIGLMLFVLKGLAARNVWKTGSLKFAFWSINIGLAAMVFISVLPVGLLQTVASIKDGLWYARSAEFLHQPYMDTLRWLRVIGDTIFAVGVLALGYFVVGLKTGWTIKETEADVSDENYPEIEDQKATEVN